MYYRFTAFYKRDVYFAFCKEKSSFDLYSYVFLSKERQKLNENITLIFNVDKIDNYINSYDLLPAFKTPLVSDRFRNLFKDLGGDIQYINTIIIDKKQNRNESFYFMNVLNKFPILDKNKSIIEYDEDGKIDEIKKMYIKANGLEEHTMVRMEEHDSYIIVTDKFKNKCEQEKLRGIKFIEEGHSIYNDV
jgi:hypothetical protein